ncbi:hypothetical protein AJ79_04800 [Helicocarpus griseus UAMH5409]|uniref:Uncharacterized protein n=1 Tax=Helicocarpus griseus UAMH5409 TaxID=1447875 RepID=A0A2B7XSD6_9EURO|nr:hypothetical protein AJ79_04800 [Helicocarpus griseus UAMH5409]
MGLLFRPLQLSMLSQLKNRQCHDTAKRLTIRSKLAKSSRTDTESLQSLATARILLFGSPEMKGPEKQYASLKVSIQHDNANFSPVLNEVNMLRRLGKFAEGSDHTGVDFTRLAQDIFEIDAPPPLSGKHYGIASKPQGQRIRKLQEISAGGFCQRFL